MLEKFISKLLESRVELNYLPESCGPQTFSVFFIDYEQTNVRMKFRFSR